jgi:hypothetical protein
MARAIGAGDVQSAVTAPTRYSAGAVAHVKEFFTNRRDESEVSDGSQEQSAPEDNDDAVVASASVSSSRSTRDESSSADSGEGDD